MRNLYRVVREAVAETVMAELKQINERLRIIMATQDEEADKLNKIGDQLDKAMAELKTAIANAGVTSPKVDAAVARLEGAAQALDDLNPDVPPAAAPAEVPPPTPAP